MNNVAMPIGHDLKLDVMRIDDELLDIDLLVPESFLGFVPRVVKRRLKAWLIMRGSHAAATTTSSRFNHHRVTDFLRGLDGLILRFDYSLASRRHGHASFVREDARGVFVTHGLHRARRGSDKLDVAAFTDFGEMRVLGKKPVAGMDGIDIANLGCAHNAIDFQITLGAGRGANADRFIRELNMQRIDVRFRINSQGTNTKFFAGANDAQCDFTAIGDQNFFKHDGGASF